jgi:Transcriptional activator of glycolytic enzymes
VQLQQTEAHVEQLRLQYEQDWNQVRALLEKHHGITNENLKRIAIVPAQCVGATTTATTATQMVNNHLGDPKAMLSPNPRSLYLIWEEWTTGLNCNKLASQFTREERGENKCKFCCRKILWDAIGNLVHAGLDSRVAIDRIHAMYGANQSVTHMMDRIKEDKKNRVVHASLNL